MVQWLLLMAVLGMDGGAATDASAPPAAPPLTGLDAELNRTGRIAVIRPPNTPIEAPAAGTPPAGRADLAHKPVSGEAGSASSPTSEAHAGLSEEYRPTEAPVVACRVEIARRRQITPDKVAARTVVVRFTVEESGRVHNAEAVSAAGTDLEVAACAKRVISGWVFPKRAAGALTVERTYRF